MCAPTGCSVSLIINFVPIFMVSASVINTFFRGSKNSEKSSFWPITLAGLVVRNENVSCHINKQEMSQPKAISSLQMWMWASQSMIQQMMPPASWLLRSWGNARSKVNKETGLAPDSWGAYERNEFSEPRFLHLLIHRMLNSWTWNLILRIRLLAPFVANLYIAWLPLLSP